MNACETCGKPCNRRWCSQACNARSRKQGQNHVCLHCSKEFYLRPCDERKGGGKYCSNACRRTYEAAHTNEYLKKGRTTIHRIVAAEKLGRPLRKGEVVHHIDGNKHNNHPDNLIVLPNQSAHASTEGPRNRSLFTHEQRVEWGKHSGKVRRARRQSHKSSKNES